MPRRDSPLKKGMYLLQRGFVSGKTLDSWSAQFSSQDWVATWPLSGDVWRVIKIFENGEFTPHADQFNGIREVLDSFKCPIKNAMFYSLIPGGVLLPHRDVVGSLGLGGIRLHVPVLTNDKITFQVEGENYLLPPGDLWALDTSYIHSVANNGTSDRVHLVLDVQVNDWVRSLLPPFGIKYWAHQIFLVGVVLVNGTFALFHAESRRKLLAFIKDFTTKLFR